MNKTFKFLTTLLLLAVSVGAWAEEETFTFSELGYENGDAVTYVNGTNVNIEFDKGTSTTASRYYTSGTAVRCYGGNWFKVTSDYSITKIDITFGTSDGSNTITTDVGSYSNGTWNGSGNSVKFTIGGSTGNRRVSAIKVTYTTGGGDPTTPTTYNVTFDAGNGTFVGNTDFPNASNSKIAGTYTLPSATPVSGYTFDGWVTGNNEPITGSYTVSDDVDFTAQYSQSEGSNTNTLTFDVSSNPGSWPTANSTTLTNYIYTLNGVNYTFALKNVKCNNGYMMMTSVAVLGLPAIEGYKLTKVVAHNSSGCSTSTKVGISSSDSQASYIDGGAIQTWSTTNSSYTYNLTSTEANTMYYLYVTNKNAQVTSLELTYELTSNTPSPSIVAENVDIAYNATGGSIAYTINNVVDGGSVSADVTQGDWLTLSNETTSPVSFTCEANTSATARTATVTLTYTYNTNQTVTKDITVTQAGNPNVVNNISDITAVNENYAIRGTIVAKSSRGLVIGDGTGYLYYYNQNYSQSNYNVGDKVKMSGTMGSYNHVYQFTSTATIETSETSNYNNTPAVQVLDATAIAAYSEDLHLSDYVQLEGTLVKSGNYYNLEVEGLDTDASISYPTTEQAGQLDALENEIVIVKGYFGGVSSNHFNVILESIEEKQLLDNAINGLEDAYTIDMTQGQEDLTFNATATSGATVQYEVISEGTTLTEDDYVLEGNELMVSKRGTIVIRAYVAANDEYKAAEKTTTVTVIGEKDDAVIVVADANVSYGSTFTVDESTIEGGAITVTSSNTSVATVNGLVITPAAVGSTTITVATAENDSYKAGSETFTLTVTAPQGQSTAPSADAVQVFYESFDESTGTTGWSGSTANGEIRYDNTGWDANKGNGNGGSAKFGTSSVMGYAITPAIGQAGDFTMTFKSGAWSGDKTEGGLVLSIDEGEGTLSQTTFDLVDSQWSDYEVIITGATADTKIKFSAAQATKNRFFLDEVKIEKPAEAVVAPKLTLSASGYASYCCQYPLDFTNIDKDTFKAWYVSAVDMTSGDVTFSEITGTIKGGEAFFLYGTPGAECQLAYAESSSVVLNGNKLVGTLAPTYVENGNGIQNYGLSGGKFVKMGNGVVKANKSYLPVEVGTETPTRLNITFEIQEATGIMNVSREGTTDNRYYNLNGQRVMNPTKGMYIVNGKKVIIK